ncbi:alpha/beta hydrolase family protein [Aspergillus thermomutatus]|uniref:Alpha/beta hydrolase fold-3 domain-containing protein n=1 Tax=Aspergillus thermomutatus TaxID=41047 RepID=A0A397HV46_ASPTH|nr:uncharacterized protein CDV56_108582 [Aspergillus thermomutatus]RHZ66892.1 hypothetical protein CDV56_108582 [Aspergillus thermomutatus]
MIPKSLLEAKPLGKVPVIVRIHGGFLVTGHSRYPPWFADWILKFASSKGAVIISPNYRLLPESSGKDILEDMDDFWAWFSKGRADLLLKNSGVNISLDHDQVLAMGDGAGGYLAVQLALSYPSQIQAVIAASPMLNLRSRFYAEYYRNKYMVGIQSSMKEVAEHCLWASQQQDNMKPTEGEPPARLIMAFSMIQNGQYLGYFGTEDRGLFPLERVEDLAAAGTLQFPPLFIFHAEQDSAVPIDGTKALVELLREKSPETRVMLHTQDGEHSFDRNATLETPWLSRGLEMISQFWLKNEQQPADSK